ncbi:DNA-directed RNA polymerase subunit delta [Siminovitchia acidinfaciens]|nr:DNA-directed RNA polymerase subunit delta [Siminovitchia acidinfaciens]
MLSIYNLALKAAASLLINIGGKVVQGLKLQELSKEERKEMSFIEIAQGILEERKQGMPFQELTAEIAKILELSDEEVRPRMVQFYTDLNVDGSFLALGENQWGLREWYPFDQVDEEIIAPVPKKKKKKSKAALEDDDLLLDLDDEELDDFEEEEEEDLEEDESLEALREEEAEFEDEDEELLDDDDYELDDDDEDDLDLEEEEEEE